MLQRLGNSRLWSPQGMAIPSAALALGLAATTLAFYWGPADNGAFDSAFYLDGARHLAAGDGYVSAYVEPGRTDYAPITHWAPGTSVLIALSIKLGASPLTAAALVLGACYVAAVLLVFGLGVRLAGSRYWPLSLLASVVFALEPSALTSLDAVLSDLPCATFALLSLWLALRVMRSAAPSLTLRFAFGLSIAWLDLVRYAGLLFIPGMLVATALGMRVRKPLWMRAWMLWPTVLTAAAGVVAWNLRNKRVADKPLGGWTFVDSDVALHVVRAARGAFVWLDDLIQQSGVAGVEAPFLVLLYFAMISLIVLAIVSARVAWRETLLVGLTTAGYTGLMIATASVTLIASLSETRFWVGVWPLELLLIVIAVAHAGPRWCLAPKLTLVATLLCAAGFFGWKTYRDLPFAREPRGLLAQSWQRASEVLPQPTECRLYVNDPRPYMLNRQLAPTSAIPASLAEFDAAVKGDSSVCIAVSLKHRNLRLSGSAEQRRVPQMEVVTALLQQHRLERIKADAGVTVYRLRL
jgi:hypothetical protein